jgi:hypothetical protein
LLLLPLPAPSPLFLFLIYSDNIDRKKVHVFFAYFFLIVFFIKWRGQRSEREEGEEDTGKATAVCKQ